MSNRKRPLTQRIRTLHRWISLFFTVIAVGLIVDTLINETASDALSLAALVSLVLLLLTGGWLVVHHYTRASRAQRRRSAFVGAPHAAAEPE